MPGKVIVETARGTTLVFATVLDARRALRYALRTVTTPPHMSEDHERTRKDIRAAVIFGIVAATLELGVLLYFFR